MNTNPAATTILCYGDSNTYGTKPDRSGRYSADKRWTGILQQLLSEEYSIIEEGLGGRTTDLEHHNPNKPSRNGLTYFKACLESHMPLDLVIIMLGTNDLKTVYDRSAEDVAAALEQYPDYIDAFCRENSQLRPRIVLISPTYIDPTAPQFISSMPTPGIYDDNSAAKSRQFAEPIQRIARQSGCLFLDAAPITKTGEDGLHLDESSHAALAQELHHMIIDTHL